MMLMTTNAFFILQVDKSIIQELVEKEPYLLDMQDEVSLYLGHLSVSSMSDHRYIISSSQHAQLLALLLMAERRRGEESFWWPYFR